MKKLFALSALTLALTACGVKNAEQATAQTKTTTEVMTEKTAIETTQIGDLTMQNLTLKTSVGDLDANLYLPAKSINGAEKPPVAIITGAWMTVKEQMPTEYAKALAERGYATLIFDFRGWGKSTDKDGIQYYESPERKIEDIKAVIEDVKGLEQIDGSQIFGLGVCASSGYMLDAVSHNPDVKAVATVATWVHNQNVVEAVYGGAEGVANLIALGEAQPASGEQALIIEAASTSNENAVMYNAPYYTEPDRGLIAEFDNKFNVASWKPWLTYDPISRATQQDKPTLFVVSEKMAIPDGTKKYLAEAQGMDNIHATWLASEPNQFDFYDNQAIIAEASNAVSDFFKQAL